MRFLDQFICDEDGVTSIEYGLIAFIVGVGIIVGLKELPIALNSLENNVAANLK